MNQLPFYDHCARRLHPRLLVLVFVSNDITDNSSILKVELTRFGGRLTLW